MLLDRSDKHDKLPGGGLAMVLQHSPIITNLVSIRRTSHVSKAFGLYANGHTPHLTAVVRGFTAGLQS